MAKMTREAREAQKAAERAARIAAYRSAQVLQFKNTFLKAQARRVYTERVAFDEAGDGRSAALAIYSMVDSFKSASQRLTREMERASEALAESMARVSSGRDPFNWSNGFTGRYGADIDRYAVQVETLRTGIQALASSTGWRVREVEADYVRKASDLQARVAVVPAADGRWLVRRNGLNDATGSTSDAWLAAQDLQQDGELFSSGGELAVHYETEELAWSAVHVLVHGRTID